MRSQSGFTLIEAMTALAVMLLCLALAAPGLSRFCWRSNCAAMRRQWPACCIMLAARPCAATARSIYARPI